MTSPNKLSMFVIPFRAHAPYAAFASLLSLRSFYDGLTSPNFIFLVRPSPTANSFFSTKCRNSTFLTEHKDTMVATYLLIAVLFFLGAVQDAACSFSYKISNFFISCRPAPVLIFIGDIYFFLFLPVFSLYIVPFGSELPCITPDLGSAHLATKNGNWRFV